MALRLRSGQALRLRSGQAGRRRLFAWCFVSVIGLLDGQEDKNGNGGCDIKDLETCVYSAFAFGEPDLARAERRVGLSGCTLIPE